MDFEEFRVAMARKNLSIPALAKVTKIARSKLYSRLSGKTQFTLGEAAAISRVLGLSNEQIIAVFFANKAS